MKVSVIIPSYNHQQYISAAVDSVLTQTYDNLELIIVDDGSKDDSLSYLRSLQDPRVCLIEQSNAGAHAAINRGISTSSGDLVAILNSDDVYHPERLAICVAELKKSRSDLVATWLEVIDDQGKVLGTKQGWHNMLPWEIGDKELSYAVSNDFSLNILMTNFVATTSNMVFTRQLFDEIGGMRNLRFAHDWDFLLRVIKHHKCTLIEDALLQYRLHGSNTISSNKSWMEFEVCWVLAVASRQLRDTLWANDIFNESDADRLKRLSNSMNLLGNDRMFWLINAYIDHKLAQGVAVPEENFLEDQQLRQAVIELA